ncbi:MAG: Sensor histidine kinase RcsC [Verrucomicrobiae bacterium]|nr:Sensor histidine kinase RcsC [Verrucomicrobiae bacterium]
MTINDSIAIPESAAPAEVKPTLLIVDDEAGPRESLRIVFKNRYNCAVATCGRDGIEYAKNNPVDAAILDIKMPDISGVEVLRALKEMDPNIECVMLTGYETVETARAAVRYGAADYLNKPFDVFAVRELLEKCMARRKSKAASAETLKALQKMNEELTRDLADSNRAVTASVLSAGVVHEINNPLSIIAGYTYLLGRDLADIGTVGQTTTQSVQLRLATIQREVERCKDIAQRFLNFARTKQRVVERTLAIKLLEDTAALVKAHPANKGCDIEVRVPNLALTADVHGAEFIQILINLCVNALHAMNGMGQLTLGCEQIQAVTEPCGFRAEKFDPARPHVRFTVTDTGAGIPPETIARIFEPFFTTKSNGNGLGLAIITELIAKYDGAIGVESRLGHGTTFSVYLPVNP